MNRAARRAFEQAAGALNTAFEQAGPFPDQEATPPLLSDAVRECLDICREADAGEEEMPAEEVDELGTHALECLTDLGLWAYQLQLDDARSAFEDLALDVALWIAGRGGRIAVLEPAVNAVARRANATRDTAGLRALYGQARALADHAAPEIAEGRDATTLQPWTTLLLNGAIIATRTQHPALMNEAWDRLEAHLPDQCAAFYAEGLRESQKPSYATHVSDLLGERFAKWTARR